MAHVADADCPFTVTKHRTPSPLSASRASQLQEHKQDALSADAHTTTCGLAYSQALLGNQTALSQSVRTGTIALLCFIKYTSFPGAVVMLLVPLG